MDGDSAELFFLEELLDAAVRFVVPVVFVVFFFFFLAAAASFSCRRNSEEDAAKNKGATVEGEDRILWVFDESRIRGELVHAMA